MLVTIYE